jgi:phage recombination protein Bet
MSVNAVAKRDTNLQVIETPAAQVVSADEWNERRIQFIRDNFANGAPDPEFDAFIQICKRRGLAPEEKQIYLIPRKGKWTPQTSIDGSRLIAERSGVYAGSDEAVFEESGQRLHNGNGKTYPLKATVTVWKIVAGVRCPFTSSAHWEEYNSGDNLWVTMPHVMLAKCAESQALRKAFPADLSGLYTIEEMEQANDRQTTTETPRARASVQETSGAAVKPPSNAGGIKALNEEMARKKLTDGDVLDLAANAFGAGAIEVLTMPQLTNLRLTIRDCAPDELGLVAATLQEIVGTDDRAGLDQHASDVEQSALPMPAQTLLNTAIKRVGEAIS